MGLFSKDKKTTVVEGVVERVGAVPSVDTCSYAIRLRDDPTVYIFPGNQIRLMEDAPMPTRIALALTAPGDRVCLHLKTTGGPVSAFLNASLT